MHRRFLAPSLAIVALAPSSFAARDVLEFQTASVESPYVAVDGGGRARLISMNRLANATYILDVETPRRPAARFHLERPTLSSMRNVAISGVTATGLTIARGSETIRCDLFGADSPLWGPHPGRFVPLCNGLIWLRSRDARGLNAGAMAAALQARVAHPATGSGAAPQAPLLAPRAAGQRLALPNLGIAINAPGGLNVGQWYPAQRADGVFVAAMQAGLVAPEILQSYPGRVGGLGADASTTSTLVALDLSKFDLGWNHGTAKPGVGWGRAGSHAGAGPDGFNHVSPFVASGLLSPAYLPGLAAIMGGGFQRLDGNVRSGPLNGTYFGFTEAGVALSRLNAGLATLTVDVDGRVDIKTWAGSDNANAGRIVYARQNNPPLIESQLPDGTSVPGEFVNNWGAGAWSGTPSKQLHAPRAAVCLQESSAGRFLIHAFFPGTTPNGMARTFQALRCKAAMHVDMNSPNQSYFALVTGGADVAVEPSVRGMTIGNANIGGRVVPLPRYVYNADEADFFFFVRK